VLPTRGRLQNRLALNETSPTIFHSGNEKYDALLGGEIFNYSFDLIVTKKIQHGKPELIYFTTPCLENKETRKLSGSNS